jgi:hypothetical protein
LPEPIQRTARKAFRLFQQNPHHSSLRFEYIPSLDAYPVGIALGYRALGRMPNSNEIVWYWIGSHADYDKLI